MNQKFAKQWAETERLLRVVLADVQLQIEPRQTAQVLEYLEHNELGLAHDTLVYAIEDRQVAVGDDAVTALDASRVLMGLPG